VTQAATEASLYLVAMAEELSAAYAAVVPARAVLLIGSAARGDSDFYSDLDLILLYADALPSDDQLQGVRARLGASAVELSGSRATGSISEAFVLRGVECQLHHQIAWAYERELAEVLEQHVARSGQQRAAEGVLTGVALHGADLITRWQRWAADYPEGLARASIEAYLRFFPLWRFPHMVATRDVELWVHQVVVESAQNVLGVLAGLNRVYYAPVQLKRTHQLVERLRLAPPNLGARLDALLAAAPDAAGTELERLVGETVGLVEQHMPAVDTSAVRRQLGARKESWTPIR
jgi:predicted nucleotidyltransferase